jgi:hypothetical protein
MYPASSDAVLSFDRPFALVHIYGIVDEVGKCLDEIREILGIPASFSITISIFIRVSIPRAIRRLSGDS